MNSFRNNGTLGSRHNTIKLTHLQDKGYISWQEGKARTMQIVDEIMEGVPIMGSVAAGGLIETYSDVQENLDISDVLKKKNVFAYNVNKGESISICLMNKNKQSEID